MDLLNSKQTSKQLNCSVSTLRRIIERKEITFIRNGRLFKFKEEDIETYINSGRSIANLNLDSIKAVNNNLTKPSNSYKFIREVNDLTGKNKSKIRHYGYGNVYPRKTGGNLTTDYYVNGKRIQKVIPDSFGMSKKEANLILLQEKLKSFDKSNETDIEPEKKNIGFRDFAKIYEEDYMKINRRNFKPDSYRLQTLCQYFKNVDLRNLTQLDIERFRASRIKRGNSKSTANRYLQLLKRMFSLAIEERFLEKNPAKKVRPFSEKDNLKERILKENEEEKLMQNCSENLKPIITMALNTGMRRAEILNLKWGHIDFEARIIKVVSERTKNEKTRHIPINDDLFKQILKLKNENGQSPFVFLNPATKKPFLDMKTPFKRACRISGIEGLRFHDLRHTFASRLVANGIDIETIRELLGHSSILITQRYLHSSDEQKRNAVEILNKKDEDSSELKAKIVTKMVTIENQSELIS